MVTVIVTPLPAAPSLTGQPYEACFDDPTNPTFTASGAGTNFNWYNVDPTTPGATPLPLGTGTNTYTSTETNPSPIGGYLYWVEEVVGSCTSLATPFTFIIHAPPAVPSITPLIAGLPAITICEGATPSPFVANSNNTIAGTFTWYIVDPVTNPGAVAVGTGTPFTPIQTAPGIYDYWLTETDLNTGCISNVATAIFTINALPVAPIVSASPSAIICFGDAPPLFTAAQGAGSTGTSTFEWYDDVALTSQVGTGLTFTPTQTAVNTYTFYVIETNSTTGCDGLASSFTFEIIVLPIAPVCTDEEICLGEPLPIFTPSTGTNLFWYDDVLLGNQVGVGPTYTAGTNQIPPPSAVGTYSYWVVDQPGTCVSPPSQVDLIINPLPTPGPIWHN
jgi:hypothetical protein